MGRLQHPNSLTTELCDQMKTLLSLELCDFFFGRPSGSLLHSKNDFHTVPKWQKSRTLICLVPCVLVAIASSLFEAVAAPVSVQPNRYVDEETTQVGGGNGLTVCLCKRSNLPTTHFRRHKKTTALGPPVKKPAVRLFFYHAGLCSKRSIAILSALRACESWSIAHPGRVNKQFIQSAKQY